MMTEGDKRWIKRHTEKTLKELNMKQTKKRPAKMTDNPIIGKLLKLKYRINDVYHLISNGEGKPKFDLTMLGDTRIDKQYVMTLINDIRKHKFTKLAPEDVHCCNGLWRKYA